jgi:hypothetical protein
MVVRRRCAGAARPARDAACCRQQLADEAFRVLALAGATLLQRLQELLDLLNAEPTLASGRPIRLEVAHIGPPANRSEGNPERVGGLRRGQTERAVPHLLHICISDAFTKNAAGCAAIAQPLL